MRKALRRLRLRPGDILVTNDYEMIERLKEIRDKNIPYVPILFAPHGIHRVSLDYLKKLVALAERNLP